VAEVCDLVEVWLWLFHCHLSSGGVGYRTNRKHHMTDHVTTRTLFAPSPYECVYSL